MPPSDPIAHCVMFSDLAHVAPGHIVEVDAEEAHHAARVKRVRPGERIGLIDGNGHWASGPLQAVGGSRSNPTLSIQIDQHQSSPPISPRLEVAVALPKGDLLDRMIDQLTQLGVASVRPLLCERSQRKPETLRPDKLARISDEAMKQCRRTWRMQIDEPIHFQDAIRDPDVVIADASGPIWSQTSDSAARTMLLVGPEGGWSNTERDSIVETNARVRRFGLFVLRIEAAAAAASAMVMCANPEPDCHA